MSFHYREIANARIAVTENVNFRPYSSKALGPRFRQRFLHLEFSPVTINNLKPRLVREVRVAATRYSSTGSNGLQRKPNLNRSCGIIASM